MTLNDFATIKFEMMEDAEVTEVDHESDIVWRSVKRPSRLRMRQCRRSIPKQADFETFDSAFGDETIVPDDNREVIPDTTRVPHRWICSLHMCLRYKLGDRQFNLMGIASGTLVGPRHVLTSAHNLFNYVQPNRAVAKVAGPFWMGAMIISPGRNGTRSSLARRPFGVAFARRIGVTRQWFDKLSTNKTPPKISVARADTIKHSVNPFDFGVIELDRAIGDCRFDALGGSQLGYWGSPTAGHGTRLGIDRSASFFNGVTVNLCGYPGDKCRDRPQIGSLTEADERDCLRNNRFDLGSTQWLSFEEVLAGAKRDQPGLMVYEHDTVTGNSGSPVWIRWRSVRSLIAVHRGIHVPGASNLGVRITPAVAARIRSWMR